MRGGVPSRGTFRSKPNFPKNVLSALLEVLLPFAGMTRKLAPRTLASAATSPGWSLSPHGARNTSSVLPSYVLYLGGKPMSHIMLPRSTRSQEITPMQAVLSLILGVPEGTASLTFLLLFHQSTGLPKMEMGMVRERQR